MSPGPPQPERGYKKGTTDPKKTGTKTGMRVVKTFARYTAAGVIWAQRAQMTPLAGL